MKYEQRNDDIYVTSTINRKIIHKHTLLTLRVIDKLRKHDENTFKKGGKIESEIIQFTVQKLCMQEKAMSNRSTLALT